MEEHRREAGRRLVQLREARRWTQEDLAREAKVSVKTVSRFENGRHDGRRATVRALAGALEVQEGDLIGDPPDPLGLHAEGLDQLDRIEARQLEIIARLDELLERLTPEEQSEQELQAEVAAVAEEADRLLDTESSGAGSGKAARSSRRGVG